MTRQSRLAWMMAGCLAMPAAWSAEWQVRVLAADGAPLPDAVVWITPGDLSQPPHPAVMDQINKTFVPYILPVQTGTTVDFPNSDSINHHVYSFSPPKRFELKLTPGGRTVHTVLFDKPGLVTLGCNIHDWMLAYIYVVDTPWFGQTGPDGIARITAPEGPGRQAHVWHPAITDDPAALVQPLASGIVSFRLSRPLRPDLRRAPHGY